MHWGWILALLSGIVTWFLAQTVITFSGAQRELVEGFTSLLAALVLFSVSYWLISKAEAKRWHRFHPGLGRGSVERPATVCTRRRFVSRCLPRGFRDRTLLSSSLAAKPRHPSIGYLGLYRRNNSGGSARLGDFQARHENSAPVVLRRQQRAALCFSVRLYRLRRKRFAGGRLDP